MNFDDVTLILMMTLGFLIIFPLFWSAVVYLLAYLSGWHALAHVYRFDSQFLGKTWSMKSARMGLANYNGVLTVGANIEGFYLKPLFLFKMGQPPLFIPWYDISIKHNQGLFGYTELRFARVPSVKLKISRGLADQLASAAGAAWPQSQDEPRDSEN